MKRKNKLSRKERRELRAGNVTVIEPNTPTDLDDKIEDELEIVDVSDTLVPSDLNVDSIISEDNNPKIEHMPRVEIPRFVFYKMMAYTKLVDEEISGLGYVEQISPNRFKIIDIYLVKQTVSGGSCEFDIDDDVRLQQELIDAGKNPSKLKMWWHSHASGSVFWSSTDENTSKRSVCDYFISIVVAHDMSLRCKLNVFKPVAIEIDNVKVVMVDSEPIEKMIENCAEEVKQKVYKQSTGRNIVYGNGYKQGAFVGFGAKGEESEPNVVAKGKKILAIPEFEPPYDYSFTIGEHMFNWNFKANKYDVTEVRSGRVLFEDEVDQLGIGEYANPYEYELKRMNRDVPKGDEVLDG